MKIMAFMGSARKKGGTAVLVNSVLAKAKKNGHTVEQVWVCDLKIEPCRACYKWRENNAYKIISVCRLNL